MPMSLFRRYKKSPSVFNLSSKKAPEAQKNTAPQNRTPLKSWLQNKKTLKSFKLNRGLCFTVRGDDWNRTSDTRIFSPIVTPQLTANQYILMQNDTKLNNSAHRFRTP